VASGKFWATLESHMAGGSIVTCVPKAGSESLGLLPAHPYSIASVKQAVGFDLIRIRNPWGREKGAWKGEWSAQSVKWDDFPEVTDSLHDDEALGWQRNVQDGTFWMTLVDFVDNFAELVVCRVFDDEEYKQYCIQGEWSGKTAGGRYQRVSRRKLGGESRSAAAGDQQQDEDPSHASGAQKDRATKPSLAELMARKENSPSRHDGDSFWFNNPQYEVVVPGKQSTTVFVSLMQEDPRTATRLRDLAPIGFEVLRCSDQTQGQRAWTAQDMIFDSVEHAYGDGERATREVVGSSIHLSPGYCYKIIPHTLKKDMEGRFVLRLFSEADLVVNELPDTHTVRLPGKWIRSNDKDSTGGPLCVPDKHGKLNVNHRWCENPQYVLRIPRTRRKGEIAVKIVLLRTDEPEVKHGKGRQKDASPTTGLVLSKAPEPEESGRNRKGRAGQVRTNALGEEMPTKMSSLKNPRSKFLQQSRDNALDPVPLDRRVSIEPSEWHLTSDYTSVTHACIMIDNFSESWAQHGLLISPTLSEAGAKGSFMLEVHSNQALQLEALPESQTRTISGEWTESSAGGSHMHGSWKKNPRYHLRVLGTERTKVKITLSRPAGYWKQQTTKDSVGSMLGFYLVQGPSPSRDMSEGIFHEGEPWSESPFVPMNLVSTPTNFELEPLEDEVYSIIPATFEPGKHGPFFLSVSSESEFTLQRDHGQGSSDWRMERK